MVIEDEIVVLMGVMAYIEPYAVPLDPIELLTGLTRKTQELFRGPSKETQQS
ncbi:hypothetical protein C8R21_103158 [Nitrosospira multiformis]|uniref:Uncharacterized protein n=1 Tax=Nitrosospira multiformis TaxID=1231 RepID=A0A2T5IGB7_9PROT|nr:hypothetical protein C8R21_103158 [Nitrosospira multiformis]